MVDAGGTLNPLCQKEVGPSTLGVEDGETPTLPGGGGRWDFLPMVVEGGGATSPSGCWRWVPLRPGYGGRWDPVPLVVEGGGTLYPWRYREVPLYPWWWQEEGLSTPGGGGNWDLLPLLFQRGGTPYRWWWWEGLPPVSRGRWDPVPLEVEGGGTLYPWWWREAGPLTPDDGGRWDPPTSC